MKVRPVVYTAIIIAIVSGFVWLVPSNTYAATLTVMNTNDAGAGSLRQAMADAAPGDTVDFAPALSGQTITLTSGELVVSKSLTIAGPAGGITVSGNNASSVFEIDQNVTVAINGVKITGGSNALSDGGGIANFGDLTLTNVEVSGNVSGDVGGGIHTNPGSTLTLISTSVSNNNAVGGAGISNYGSVFLINSTVTGNMATGGLGGGGIDNWGSLTITNSTISDNTAPFSIGGGIDNSYGTISANGSLISGNSAIEGGGLFDSYYGAGVTLTDTRVVGNVADEGGGIKSQATNGQLVLIRTTVSGNTADQGGGILQSESGTILFLVNSTVSGNHAQVGGGISTSGPLALLHTTVSNNSAGQGGGLFTTGHADFTSTIIASQASGGDCSSIDFSGLPVSHGYNLDSDGSCSLTAIGDLPNTDPMLQPLALNPPGNTETHALTPGSPAINHIPPGTNGCGTTITTDQRGVARPQGAGCEIGSYEVEEQPASPTATATPAATPTASPTGSPQISTPTPVFGAIGGVVEMNVTPKEATSGIPLSVLVLTGGLTALAAVYLCWRHHSV